MCPWNSAAIEKLGSQFERTTSHKLTTRFGLPSQLKEAIAARALDVAILSRRFIDAL